MNKATSLSSMRLTSYLMLLIQYLPINNLEQGQWQWILCKVKIIFLKISWRNFLIKDKCLQMRSIFCHFLKIFHEKYFVNLEVTNLSLSRIPFFWNREKNRRKGLMKKLIVINSISKFCQLSYTFILNINSG